MISQQPIDKDWRMELIKNLENLSFTINLKLKQKTPKYILLDEELYKRESKGLLLKCLNESKAIRVMA